MTSLLSEIVLFLGAAALIGFVMGWVLRSLRSAAAAQSHSHEGSEFRDGLSDEVHGLVTRLDEQDRGSKETISRMASEIEELRGLLENLPATHDESVDGKKSEEQARSRAEAAMRELDQIKSKFEELNQKHQDLQKSYHKVADRIVEYEREKMTDRGSRKPVDPHAERPVSRPKAAPSKPAAPASTNQKATDKSELDLGDIERSGEPAIAAGIFEENEPVRPDSGTPLSRAVKPLPPRSKPAEDVAAKSAKSASPPGSKKLGCTHPLSSIVGIPSDVRTRLEVLGVKNNQQLLQKCSTESGLNALCKSMGLKVDLLSRWASAADLSRLECMRKEDTPDLLNIGVESVQALANSKADILLNQLRSAPKSHGSATLEAAKKWIDEAKSLQPILRW